MRCERCAVFVSHDIGIAVVGCKEAETAHLNHTIIHHFGAFVYSFNSIYCSFKAACVADHIAVCKVEDDNIVLARFDFLNCCFSNFKCAHFRLFVVCLDLWRRNQYTLFAVKCLFFAAVEEECHVGILFSFSNSELLEAALGNVFAENICKLCWLECNMNILEAFVILCEADVVRLDNAVAVKAAFVLCEGCCDFTCSVRTEVEEDNGVVRCKTCVSWIYHWLEEFVCYAFFIALFDRCDKVVCLFAFHLCDSVISKLKTLPALVSVHSIESAHDSSNCAASLLLHIVLQVTDKALCRCWGNVTSVCEAVNEWGDALFLAEVDEC